MEMMQSGRLRTSAAKSDLSADLGKVSTAFETLARSTEALSEQVSEAEALADRLCGPVGVPAYSLVEEAEDGLFGAVQNDARRVRDLSDRLAAVLKRINSRLP